MSSGLPHLEELPGSRETRDDLRGSDIDHAINKIHELEAENRALTAENERLGRILDSPSDYAIITLDSGGRITGWMGGARQILGYETADILGKCFSKLVCPESRDDLAFALVSCRSADAGRIESQGWHIRQDGSRFWGRGAVMPLLDTQGNATGGAIAIIRDGSLVREREEHSALLMAEVNHRIKNIFYAIRALAAQSWWFARSASDFQAAFDSRLLALAQAQDLLLSGGQDAHLERVIGDAVAMYLVEPKRVVVQGPLVLLTASQVTTLTLMFHELRANAEKHGALSFAKGLVDVSWTLEHRDAAGSTVAEILWQERHGPTVATPQYQGFGTYVLGPGFVQFGSSVNLEFHTAGIRCRIVIPTRTGRSLSKGG